MKYLIIKTIPTILILMIAAPLATLADPPGPGGGDPYATPVNGGVAAVAVVAFLYGAFRIYQLAKKRI